ncbi:MAG TPA: PEP-CTERM sorting domain-containing protein [Candidatus Acidoferrales bacterium]
MNINRLKSVTLGMLSRVPVLVLLALACLPVATRADSFTLNGASIDSFSFGATKTFSVQMATADALQYETDAMLGTRIHLLTLDEFVTVDGTPTENVLEFAGDVVQSFHFVTGTDMLTSDVTFHYTESKIITEASGGGTTAPEPSSVALLAFGLLGLIGFGRKKQASARDGGSPGCWRL